MKKDEVERLVRGEHHEPHRLLGAHTEDGRVVHPRLPPRRHRGGGPGRAGGQPSGSSSTRSTRPACSRAPLTAPPRRPAYRLEVTYASGSFTIDDPYRFWPTIGELDLYLLGEGRHERLWQKLGAHEMTVDGVAGTAFAVWAPNARAVRVVGDFNSWDGRLHPMRALGSSGIWELFVPGVAAGARYKYELVTAVGGAHPQGRPGRLRGRARRPRRPAVVYTSGLRLGRRRLDGRPRSGATGVAEPMSIYEIHLGSWRQGGLSYRELADQLPDYLADLGFTHVEFMPVAEHPYAPSWGYQVSAYYAPTARFGTPDDLRYLVDTLHQRGIGVLVDWVPAHFPKDAFALARFDGTALYEHEDPRRGEHPDWGSLVFNFGRNEVRNFLIANALYWLEEFHIDGLRVDAVASMLYLDYSRNEGEWVPNEYGGNENLDAVRFLKDFNTVAYREHPGAMTMAEESTAWPSVSRPVYLGGLGFGFKWNMGWMHDTLQYISKDPIYRRFHHHQLTFSLIYAFSENFILPISHDEVVHGKGSLLGKMPGDRWQQFANLRALPGLDVGPPGQAAAVHGLRAGPGGRVVARALDRLGVPWPTRTTRACRPWSATSTASTASSAALWQQDSKPEGFSWIDPNDVDDNALSFVRWAADGRPLVCLCNFSPVPRSDYRIGLPTVGRWVEVLNTDSESYGGTNVGNMGVVESEAIEWDGQPASARVTLPPLATVWLAPE